MVCGVSPSAITSCSSSCRAAGAAALARPAALLAERHKAWDDRLPKDRADLWDWPTTLSGHEQAALFAHCASFGVNALYEKGDRYGGGVTPHTVEQRIADADRIAKAVDLDMVEAGWRPTVENYLGRVPKRHILDAVREGTGERAAQLMDHLKKGDMGKEAERLLADTGWLPEPLRMGDRDEAKNDPQGICSFASGITARGTISWRGAGAKTCTKARRSTRRHPKSFRRVPNHGQSL